MSEIQIVNPQQKSAYDSPWPVGQRFLRALWEFCWTLFCVWTPKPLNEWRLFWLRVFDAKIDGTPFVHQRARIAIPWNLTLHDRACLGDRANAYSLGEIEIGARATVAQEVYLSGGTHDYDWRRRIHRRPRIRVAGSNDRRAERDRRLFGRD